MDDLESILLEKTRNQENNQNYENSEIENIENESSDSTEFEDLYGEPENLDLNLELGENLNTELDSDIDISNLVIQPVEFDSDIDLEINLNPDLDNEINDNIELEIATMDNNSKLTADMDNSNNNSKDTKNINEDIHKKEKFTCDKLNEKLDNLYKKLHTEYEKYESLFKHLDSMCIKESDNSANLSDSESKTNGKKDSFETNDIKSIYKNSNQKNYQTNLSQNVAETHHIYRRIDSRYVNYSKIVKSFMPIVKSLIKSKNSLHTLILRVGSLKYKLESTLKFYQMIMKKYNLEELKTTIDNLKDASDKVNLAFSNAEASCYHVSGAIRTFNITKGTRFLQNEYLRNKLTSTIVQQMKIASDRHMHTKNMVKSVIETVKEELDKVIKLNFADRKNSLLNYRTNKMKNQIKMISKLTITASIHVLTSQNCLTKLEKSASLSIPEHYRLKLNLLSLYENDSLGPLDLHTLQFRQLFGLFYSTNCKISPNFGLANSDLMKNLEGFKKQLYLQLHAVRKNKRHIYRSQFLIVNEHKVFNVTLNSNSEGIHRAYCSTFTAMKYIKICIMMISRCIVVLNLILENHLHLTAVEQLVSCMEAFIREATGNQLLARQEINSSLVDLENSYIKINSSRNGDPNLKLIDVKKQMSKMNQTVEESNRAMIKAFILSEWVGITEIDFENNTVPIDYPTLSKILNDKYKIKA